MFCAITWTSLIPSRRTFTARTAVFCTASCTAANRIIPTPSTGFAASAIILVLQKSPGLSFSGWRPRRPPGNDLQRNGRNIWCPAAGGIRSRLSTHARRRHNGHLGKQAVGHCCVRFNKSNSKRCCATFSPRNRSCFLSPFLHFCGSFFYCQGLVFLHK